MMKAMRRKSKFSFLFVILAVIVALMTIIAFVPGAEKIVPAPVYDFASKFYAAGIGVLLVVLAVMFMTSSPVIGVALLLIGAFVIWQNIRSKGE